jgi:hypothetical protein
MHWRGDSVNLMHGEHRCCSELDGGVEGERLWMICECGATLTTGLLKWKDRNA